MLATMWTADLDHLRADDSQHSQAKHLILHGARLLDVAESFSDEQIATLQDDRSTDVRLQAACDTAETVGHGRRVIQTLAGGPSLVDRFEHPRSQAERFARATVTAAMDARGLGYRLPIPLELLQAAGPGYIEERDRVDAPPDWIHQGLRHAAYLPSHGVTALAPRRLATGPGPADSYALHDYLDEHSGETRVRQRRAPLPATLWEALVAHTTDTEIALSLADHAFDRLLYRYGLALYQKAALEQPRHVSEDVTELFEVVGDRAARVLYAREDADELRRLATAGSDQASMRLAVLLEQRGDVASLFELTRHGNLDARWRLFHLLAERRDARLLGELVDLLPLPDHRIESEEDEPNRVLAQLLDEHSDLPELRRRVALGDPYAAQALASVLARLGMLEELRGLVDAGVDDAEWPLAEALAAHGEIDELRRRAAAAGESGFRHVLAKLLMERHAVDELKALSEGANDDAPGYLAKLLDQLNDVDELRRLARRRTPFASRYLKLNRRRSQYLAAPGGSRKHEAARNRFIATLVEYGEDEELRELAAAGDAIAQHALIEWLADRDRIAELITFADADDPTAMSRLAEACVRSPHQRPTKEALAVLRRLSDQGSPRALTRSCSGP